MIEVSGKCGGLRYALMVFLYAVLSLGFSSPSTAAPGDDTVFFDLGETVVTGSVQSGFKYAPGAWEALVSYKAAGYKLGLISNVPDTWGDCSGKSVKLKAYIADNWRDDRPFDWGMFGVVILPPKDSYQKPHPLMFNVGLAEACSGRAVFIGETAAEVAAARDAGLAGIHKPSVQSAFPDVAGITQVLEQDFHAVHPASCDYKPIIDQLITAEDRTAGLTGCVHKSR